MSQEEHTLIELVHKMTHLWDKSHRSYKDKIAIDNSWQTISAIMHIDVADCKQLWASIRTRYVRERRIIKNLPSGSGAYTSKWPLFQYCGFLDATIHTRRTMSNIIGNTPGCSKELWQDAIWRDDGSVEIESECIQEGAEVEESFEEMEYREEEDKENEPISKVDEIKKIQSANKRKKPTNDIDNLVETCTTLGGAIKALINPPEKESKSKEDHYFSLSITESLLHIKHNKKKIRLKSKILELIAANFDSDSD